MRRVTSGDFIVDGRNVEGMMSHVQAQVQRSGGGASGFKQEGARVGSRLSKRMLSKKVHCVSKRLSRKCCFH